ncbi:MAG: HEPN domain-containing protein [Firmicutes bacterium]|nr:HEPN domain-containing protein [Bacillota bacterium]
MQYNDILIQRNIEKSNEALEVAEESLEKNRLTTALNRIYYAIFYTVTALAYKYDFATSKHFKLMGWFNKKFIYEDKFFEPKIFKIYKNAFMLRQESDYEAIYNPNLEQAKELLKDAKKFIETVRKII